MTTDQTALDNLPLRFLSTLEEYPDIEVLRWKDADGEWASWTMQQLADETARLTTALRNLGVGAGDRVVLMLMNRPEFHALDLAVMFLGATPISIYNSSAPEQIEYLVGHCGAKVAIVENAAFFDRFAQVRGALPTLEHLAVVDDPAGATGGLSYAELAASEPTDLAPLASTCQPDDLATVIYTSGTTGPPKGVMLTHSNITFTLGVMERQLEEQTDIGEAAGKRYISYLPMAHIFERLLGHYYMINLATQVICCPDTSKIAAYAAETSPHILIGVPRVWEKIYAGVNAVLSADPEKGGPFNEAVEAALPIVEKMTWGTATDEEIETWNFLDAVAFSQVRPLVGLNECKIAISGAAPLPAEIMAWFRAIGVPLTEGYGLSETTAALTWAGAVKPGYVGFAADGVELKLGDDGEVLTRGKHVFPGYLNDPEKTAEAIDEDGWFHTGDIGEIDDDGYLKIVDRKKELIITAGGKNISPANLEASLKMIPLVGQACAIGDQKPFVSALVVLDPDAAAAWAARHGLTGDDASMAALAENPDVLAEIDAGLAEAMSKYNNAEAVKKVKVLADEWLPDSALLTPTSKLKRRGVMSTFAAEIDALYAK
ncbi:MAG: AMP-dependent synthetase/ligase [Acidimicrobiales bacterium]